MMKKNVGGFFFCTCWGVVRQSAIVKINPITFLDSSNQINAYIVTAEAHNHHKNNLQYGSRHMKHETTKITNNQLDVVGEDLQFSFFHSTHAHFILPSFLFLLYIQRIYARFNHEEINTKMSGKRGQFHIISSRCHHKISLIVQKVIEAHETCKHNFL